MIARQPISNLVTIDENGFPAERAMYTARVDDDFTVYFATSTEMDKCAQIQKNPGIVVFWPIENGYLSLRGEAEVTTDQAARNLIWQDVFAAHFKGGCSDPTLAVIKITPRSLSYYKQNGLETEDVLIG